MVEPLSSRTTIKRMGNRTVVSALQHAWLASMGVDVPWLVSDDSQTKTPAASAAPPAPVTPTALAAPVAVDATTPMGNPSRRAEPKPEPVQSSAPAIDLVQAPLELMDLASLGQAVGACQACGLCEGRQQAVPGDGVDKPTVLIVGEAPGEQEDIAGKPFVGRSGQLLDNMMAAIGHGRETTVFITNVVKCRPPANRNPREDEIAACAPYLARQIELLAPQVILAMGRFAAHALLNTDAPLQELRQTTHVVQIAGRELPVVVTYHPAYLLRRPVDKRLAWQDLKQLRSLALA